jgi:hypothetical protein
MRKTLFVGTLILAIFACSTGCKRNHYEVNTSGIDLTVKVRRLEKDLFTANPGEIKSSVPALKQEYDGFLQLFSFVINIGLINDSSWNDRLVSFCTDKQNNEVYSVTNAVFPDLKNLEQGLTNAFKHYRYYFPEKSIPKVYTCISGFNNSIITMRDSILGIGLDRYLGADCKYYPGLKIYKYQAAKMNPVNIIPDCMYGWASIEWNYKDLNYSPDNVLSEMIHEGKLMYFVKSMLPSEKDNLIFGYTPQQMKFCTNNEKQMWQYLVENNLLFSTQQLVKRKLTGDAPFTSYFSKESPGRSAVWLGFRIIESYMARNRNITLAEMMMNTDCQQILEKAKYSPR